MSSFKVMKISYMETKKVIGVKYLKYDNFEYI